MFGIGAYAWGDNLWHSAAVKLMSPGERHHVFGRRKVLVFDEILQRGRELARLGTLLQEAHATVASIVCVRKRSIVERGALAEQSVTACEDLDDTEFADRTYSISKLTSSFRPPLDVDHLVVRGTLDRDLDVNRLLERLSRWGLPFLIWHPESNAESNGNDRTIDSGSTTLAISLDRPQFFESDRLTGFEQFSIAWDGPCKVRFYIEPGTRTCYCSFIAYPTIEATTEQWHAVAHSPRGETPARYRAFAWATQRQTN